MKTCKIKLASIQDVREFVDIVTGFNVEIDLSSGRYVWNSRLKSSFYFGCSSLPKI